MSTVRRRELLFGTAGAAALTLAGLRGARAGRDRSYILATATTGGTYYPVGVAIATLIKVKLQPKQKIDMSAISSAGSGENVKLLRENQAQFAILQGLFGKWAWTGTGRFAGAGPQTWLRSVTMLWQNVEHFLLYRDYVTTGTVMDLENAYGKPFSIGKKNSGTEGSGRTILGNLGIDPEKFELVYLGYGPTADALQNGNVVGANLPAGPPVSAVTRAMAAVGERLAILKFPPELAAKADGGMNLWTPYTLEAGTYPNQDEDVPTIAQPNFLGVRADVDEEAVYLIVKTIYENLPFLHNIHAATKAMALEKAIAGLPAPLHPGALRFYREAGLEIPEHLLPPQ